MMMIFLYAMFGNTSQQSSRFKLVKSFKSNVYISIITENRLGSVLA